MLGIDGKEKPSYVEGDLLNCELDGKKHPVVVRGRATENLIDLWIVEFEQGSPSPESYPFSCASIPHTMLTRREVFLVDVLAKDLFAISDGRGRILEHFGLNELFYNICDMRECYWKAEKHSFGWWDGEDQVEAAKDEAESDDPADWEAMYSKKIYGTSVWSTAEYTLAVLNDGCGNRDAYLFAVAKRVS